MGTPVIRAGSAERAQASIMNRRDEQRSKKRALQRQRAAWIRGGMEGEAPTGEGRGRHKTVVGQHRSETRSFSISLEDYVEVKARAGALHLEVSDYVRMIVLGIDFCSDLPHIAPDRREKQIRAVLAYASRDALAA